MDGTNGTEQEFTREHYLGAKPPTYEQIRPCAYKALQMWLAKDAGTYGLMDTIELSKTLEDNSIPQQDRQKAQFVWDVRRIWMKTLLEPNENFPTDQQFTLTVENKNALLFMLKMLKDEQDLTAKGFKKLASNMGLTIPQSYNDITLPDNFLEQVSKRKDLERIIASKKRAEKQKAAV